MIFHVVRYWIKHVVQGWFRRVYTHYGAPLPEDAPIVFACTHPNSAIDYLFAPLVHNKRTFVLVRGDVFENRYLNAIFRALFMLPVYRIRDGFSTLNKNDQSFKDCYREFDKNGRLLVFSEGICVQEKTLQPIKKGTARLALDYVFKHGGKKIYVVPMATNYTRFRSFRATVMVNYGAAIDVRTYGELYAQNPNKAYEALTADITAVLQRNFIQEKDYRDDSITEKALMALRLNRYDERTSWVIEDRSIFNEEKALVDALNSGGENALSPVWKELAASLALNPCNQGLLVHNGNSFTLTLQMVLLAPFIGAAWCTVAIPYLISRWIIKHKIKDKIFDNTVTIYGTLVFYLLIKTALLIGGLLLFGWMGILIPLFYLLITLIGLEVVDSFVFAYTNRKNMAHKTGYQMLYDEVAALIPATLNV